MRFYVRNHMEFLYMSHEHMPYIEIPLYVIVSSMGRYIRSADGTPIQSMSRKLIEQVFVDGEWEKEGAEIVELDE